MGVSWGVLDAPMMGASWGTFDAPVMPPMLFFDNLVKKLDKLSL